MKSEFHRQSVIISTKKLSHCKNANMKFSSEQLLRKPFTAQVMVNNEMLATMYGSIMCTSNARLHF